MDNLGQIPQKGVYVFYENGKPLYVGRSNTVKKRLKQHSYESSKHYSAQFAYKLANEMYKEKSGSTERVTRKDREQTLRNEGFMPNAITRIKQMDILVVEIEDQPKQALFELYAVVALKPKYNDLSTH